MEFDNLTQILQVLKQLPKDDQNYLSTHCNECTIEQLIYYIKDFKSDIDFPELEALTDQPEYQLGKKLMLYVSPILLVIGTIGNLLSFIVLKAHGSKVSTYSYLAALAVMDLFVLYIGLLRLWVAQLTGLDIRDHSDWLCKFVMFFAYVCSDSSVWLIIIVTIERYIAVQYPLRAAILCKVKRARIIAFLPVVILCVANFHFFWTVSLNPFNDKVECIAKPSFSILVDKVWPWVDAALYSFCPFIIITVLNCLIVQQVCKAKRRREMYMQQKYKRNINHKRSRTSEASMRLTLMLLAVSFSFLLTTLPMNIMLIAGQFWNSSQARDLHRSAVLFLVKYVTELLMYANHSINFFLYCATGKKFRTTLIEVLCSRGRNCCGKAIEEKQTIMRSKYAITLSRYGSERSSDCLTHHV